MAKSVNRLRNPEFSQGRLAPRHWTLHRRGPGVSIGRDADGAAALVCRRAGSQGWVSQSVRCKPGEYYRVEAVVNGAPVVCSEDAGAFLSIRTQSGLSPAVSRRTPTVHAMERPTTVRAYFQAPAGVREAQIGVGLCNAIGSIQIQEVRFIHILEPEEESHPLALPPTQESVPAPVQVDRLVVCSAAASARPISAIMSLVLGRSGVSTLEPKKLNPAALRGDALFLPDPTPPPAIRSLQSLEAVAERRVVVISLPAFEKIAKGRVLLRRIEQPDDPIHAKVADSNFATIGFALHDVFPFAVPGKRIGGFAQNQFRKTPQLSAFCKRNGYVTLLTSMCHSDAWTGHPVGLLRSTPRGAILVLDLEPLEAVPSTFAEPAPGLHLLLSALGRSSPGLGQFTVPARTRSAIRELIRETANRFAGFNVHDEDVPADKIETQFATVGGPDESFGLPLPSRPVILVRSGLTAGDAESVYAAWAFFKQLVRPPPHACPYAQALVSKFRLAWVPIVADWETREGWRRSGAPPPIAMDLEIEDAPVAGLIDVASTPINRHRVLFARGGELHDRARRWLPPLGSAFGPALGPAFTVPGGSRFGDRSVKTWRYDRASVSVECDSSNFSDEIHRQVLDAGGDVVRIECPGDDADFVNHSIARLGAAAGLLEHVVGLCHGLIAVNRGGEPCVLDGFAPVASGQALIFDAADRTLNAVQMRTG